jgi:hypothetical protein
MIALTLVLVAILVIVAAIAILVVTFWLKLRKRLWIGSLTQFTDLIVSMVHQFRVDETNRQHRFEQEQKVLKVQAQDASIARTLRGMDYMQKLMMEEFNSSN